MAINQSIDAKKEKENFFNFLQKILKIKNECTITKKHSKNPLLETKYESSH